MVLPVVSENSNDTVSEVTSEMELKLRPHEENSAHSKQKHTISAFEVSRDLDVSVTTCQPKQ